MNDADQNYGPHVYIKQAEQSMCSFVHVKIIRHWRMDRRLHGSFVGMFPSFQAPF